MQYVSLIGTLHYALREVETVRRELPALMCGVAQLAVPLVVDMGVGPNWEQTH